MPLQRAVAGGAPFEFAGRRWWLRITYRVLSQVEEATGIDMLSASADLTRPTSRMVRALLWAALLSAGSGWTENQVGERLNLRNLFAAHQAVLNAWVKSMPDPEVKKKKGSKPAGVAKALNWLDAWAEATSPHGLGLTEAQWLDLTPRQLHALRKVHLEEIQRAEYLAGTIAAAAANYGFCRPKRALSPESFMPHPLDAPELPPVTGEMIMAAIAPLRAELERRKVS